jgi:hypothetical protein
MNIIESLMANFCDENDGKIIEIKNKKLLSNFSSNIISVTYESSIASHQIMIHRVILINEETGKYGEIPPVTVTTRFKKDKTIEKSESNPITVLSIYESNPKTYTHFIFSVDGFASIYKLPTIKLKKQKNEQNNTDNQISD